MLLVRVDFDDKEHCVCFDRYLENSYIKINRSSKKYIDRGISNLIFDMENKNVLYTVKDGEVTPIGVYANIFNLNSENINSLINITETYASQI